MSEILPNKLYLGSLDDAINCVKTHKFNLTDIMTVAADLDLTELNLQTVINFHNFPIYDTNSQNIADLFPILFEIIDKSQTILVHCAMGISRSATVVIGYLMYAQKMTLEDATAHVLTKHNVFPNDGFMLQLIHYEKTLFGYMSFLPNSDGLRKYKRFIHGFGA